VIDPGFAGETKPSSSSYLLIAMYPAVVEARESILEDIETIAIPCPIQRLPVEILQEIFKHLSSSVRGSSEGGIWDSLQPPEPESFLAGVLTVYTFSPLGSHWEHSVLRVCRQWRAILRTNLFASKIVIDSDGSHATLDRVSKWLRNTGNTQLECEFPWRDEYNPVVPGLIEKTNEVLGHISRMTVLSLTCNYPMVQPLLSRSVAYAAPNLVSLALCVPPGLPGEPPPKFQEETHIASVELARLEFLRISAHFIPPYLRLFAPRLQTLELRPYLMSSPHFTVLGTCFPAVKVLHMDSDLFELEDDELIMPFPQLTALHIIMVDSDQEHIPLLEGCPKLRDISLSYPITTTASKVALPSSSAIHFMLERQSYCSAQDESWLSLELFDSLPNLQHLFIRDHPEYACSYSSSEEMAFVQAGNGRMIALLQDGACPRLESLTFEDSAVRYEALSRLMDKRPSLKLTWSRHDMVVSIASPEQIDQLRQLERFDDPKAFFSSWVDSDDEN
jgi:hypothetical protein